jgi:hypothetical protein
MEDLLSFPSDEKQKKRKKKEEEERMRMHVGSESGPVSQ